MPFSVKGMDRLVVSPGTALFLAALGMAPVHMDPALASLSLSVFQEVFGILPAGLANLLKSHLLFFLLGLLPSGFAADRYGAANVFRAGCVAVLAGALLGVLSASWMAVLVARGVQGLGSAALLTSAPLLIHQSFSPEARRQALARWATWGALTYAVSPLLGSFVLNSLGWRVLFALPLLPALLAVALTLGWKSGGSAPAAVSPPWTGVLRYANGCHLVGLLVNLAFMPTFFLVGLLDAPSRQSAYGGAALLLSLTLSLPLGSWMAEYAVHRLGAQRTLWGSLLLAGMGQCALGWAWHAGAAPSWLLCPLVAVGLGSALASPALLSIMLERGAAQSIGKSMSLFALARQAGSLLGVALVGYGLGTGAPGAHAVIAWGLGLAFFLAASISAGLGKPQGGLRRFFSG